MVQCASSEIKRGFLWLLKSLNVHMITYIVKSGLKFKSLFLFTTHVFYSQLNHISTRLSSVDTSSKY